MEPSFKLNCEHSQMSKGLLASSNAQSHVSEKNPLR